MALFSFASFLLMLRETLEAALIVSILIAYLNKTNAPKFKKDVWIGIIAAVAASIIGAVLFVNFLGEFEGDTEKLFEGIVMIFAAAMLSWMIIWMMRNAHMIKYELQAKVDAALEDQDRYALMTLAFIAVFREGIESILLLGGVSATEPQSTVLFSGFLGAITATAIALLFFRGVISLDLKKFFNITSVLLILFAAGLFAHGIHEFQELGWFGPEDSFINTPLFVLPLSDSAEVSQLGALLRALFGYQDKPTPLEIFSYLFYWVAIYFVNMKIKEASAKKQQATVTSSA